MSSIQYSLFPIPDGFTYVREMTTGFLGPTALVKSIDAKKLFVCKVVEKSRIGSESAVSKFVERLDHIAALSLPNVVSYSNIIMQNSFIFMFRDYIDSPSLTDIPDLVHQIDYHQLWTLLIQTYSSLHSHTIYPTFIKPNNIFLLNNKRVLITDIYTPPQDIDLMVHSPNPFDIGFLAPEFFTRSIQPDKAADTWSLGILLIYIFTGSLPWSTKNVFTMLNQITLGRLNISADLPDPVRYIISRFVQTEPSQRPMLDSLLIENEHGPPKAVQLTRLVSSPNAPIPPLPANPLSRTDSVPPPSTSTHYVKCTRMNTNIGLMAAKEKIQKPMVHRSSTSLLKAPTNLAPQICVVRCRVADPLTNHIPRQII